jgi:CheY-like chemotaxis protein
MIGNQEGLSVQETIFCRKVPEDREPMSIKASTSARILIAEDDESNRKVTSAMVRHLGYQADAVSNGREALQAMESQTYDLILMDLKMPELNGLEAARLIRKRYHPQELPKIIALTACVLPENKYSCLEAGMDDFLAKPVKLDELAQMLCKHLQQRKQMIFGSQPLWP